MVYFIRIQFFLYPLEFGRQTMDFLLLQVRPQRLSPEDETKKKSRYSPPFSLNLAIASHCFLQPENAITNPIPLPYPPLNRGGLIL